MHEQFWHERWEKRQIGFHEGKPNELLVKYLSALNLNYNERIFLPLCGKTVDIAWLLSQGYRIAGAELSELAIQELFEDLKIKPQVTSLAQLKHYSAPNLDIFVGNIFNLSTELLGKVDAIYDRAALVALPPEMRTLYTEHLVKITNCAPQLLIVFEYPQGSMQGPPFSIAQEEIEAHYSSLYDMTLLNSTQNYRSLRATTGVSENLWLLKKKN